MNQQHVLPPIRTEGNTAAVGAIAQRRRVNEMREAGGLPAVSDASLWDDEQQSPAVGALPPVRHIPATAVPVRPLPSGTKPRTLSLSALAESRGVKLGDSATNPTPASGANGREVMEEAIGGEGWSPGEVLKRDGGEKKLTRPSLAAAMLGKMHR